MVASPEQPRVSALSLHHLVDGRILLELLSETILTLELAESHVDDPARIEAVLQRWSTDRPTTGRNRAEAAFPFSSDFRTAFDVGIAAARAQTLAELTDLSDELVEGIDRAFSAPAARLKRPGPPGDARRDRH